MIWRRIAKRKPEELFEREPIVDLAFQFGIRRDAEPFLKKYEFKDHQRWISINTFVTFFDILFIYDDFETGQIDETTRFLEGFQV